MSKNNKQYTYFGLILIHAFLGIIFYFIPFLTKLYSLAVLFFGVVYVLKTANKSNEILTVSSYIISSEIFLRMTRGNWAHEFGKYQLLLFIVLGMYYSGFSKKGFIYGIFIVLLIPGILVATTELDFDTNIRKVLVFNLLGPFCLAIASIYCYKRNVTGLQMKKIFVALSMPIVTLVVYLFLYTPDVEYFGTQSNFLTSGGYGPNQVSTTLGLGMFVFFALFLLYSKTNTERIFNLFFALFVSYRGIITFSRGGVFTAGAMISILLILAFVYTKKRVKFKLLKGILVVFGLIVLLWSFSVYQTGGMIEKRYANQDAIGRTKKDRLGGREEISLIEIQLFLDNPMFGAGVGVGKEYRENVLGIRVATHNEVTRLLGEHGFMGALSLLLLISVPLLHFIDNRQNVFILPLFCFWFLTINHAATRLAAPSLLYALSLLKFNPNEKDFIRRE